MNDRPSMLRNPAPGARLLAATAAAASAAALTAYAPVADACGCFSPPVPAPEVSASEYAVNQQAEQIIFEVGDGTVTAHVLIKYEGSPESFAWLVPVPDVPDLALGSSVLFGLIDDATAPQTVVQQQNLCPAPAYRCQRHPAPYCPTNTGTNGAGASSGAGGSTASGGFDSGGVNAPSEGGSPVDVKQRVVVGSYDTVTFGAGDASAAVSWLQTEGFIVNDEMTPFMQSYLDAGMLFVASKLIPGADVSEIRPLKMTYTAANPMVPLKLTAVAAEPHLTVTSYVLGQGTYRPDNHPLMEVPAADLTNVGGRINYPMLLARVADEAGGDGFVAEYAGAVPTPTFDGCNGGGFVPGGGFQQGPVPNNGVCECPTLDSEAADCQDIEGLLEAVDEMERLAASYTTLTRLTTRVSPREMTFDPAFVPGDVSLDGPLVLQGSRNTLAACDDDVIDRDKATAVEEMEVCAATYCGEGTCAAVDGEAACICDAGQVARVFTDLDGQPSLTCVQAVNIVDLAAGGLDLPDACDGYSCGDGGRCIDVGGFPTCACDGTKVASLVGGVVRCVEGMGARSTMGPGATDPTDALEDVRVCDPPPPTDCGTFGWLEPVEGRTRTGIACDSSKVQDPSILDIPPEPTCADVESGRYPGVNSGSGAAGTGGASSQSTDDDGDDDGGGCSVGGTPATPLASLLALLGLVAFRRRQKAL